MVDVQSLLSKGNELYGAGDFFGARLHYQAALQEDQNCTPAQSNMAVALADEGSLEAAEVYARRVLASDPKSVEHLSNLGNILTRQKRYDEAAKILAYALVIDGNNAATWYNLALLDRRQNKIRSAQVSLKRAIVLYGLGATPQMRADYAQYLLADRNTFEEGLTYWDARWELGPTSLIRLLSELSEWKGQDLGDKTLLLWMEQGFGDIIMMLRLVPILKAYAKNVIVALPRSLISLVGQQFWNVQVVDHEDLANVKFDLHIPSFSALRYINKRLWTSGFSYLTSGTQYTTKIDKFRVGLCWASGTVHARFAEQRKVDLKLLLRLAAIPGVELTSLQKGPDADDIAACSAESLIADPMRRCEDWLDSARVISELDLVVSVDTAVAHLAGAMGKPTIMLAQHTRCWRWWEAESGRGGPWYPSMQVIWQDDPFSWESAIDQATLQVRAYVQR